MGRALRIEVRTQGFRPTPAISAHVERELLKALGRARTRAGDVVAFLSDVNGPRGGPDKLCQLRARLIAEGELFASAAGPDLYEAIGQAAKRLARAVSRNAGQRRVRRPGLKGEARP